MLKISLQWQQPEGVHSSYLWTT